MPCKQRLNLALSLSDGSNGCKQRPMILSAATSVIQPSLPKPSSLHCPSFTSRYETLGNSDKTRWTSHLPGILIHTTIITIIIILIHTMNFLPQTNLKRSGLSDRRQTRFIPRGDNVAIPAPCARAA